MPSPESSANYGKNIEERSGFSAVQNALIEITGQNPEIFNGAYFFELDTSGTQVAVSLTKDDLSKQPLLINESGSEVGVDSFKILTEELTKRGVVVTCINDKNKPAFLNTQK
jgi:hypothetical protein